jgi:hypothetical protein
MATKTYNNDIFKVLTEIDKRNFDFFKTYDDKKFKELQPYTLLRWLSSVSKGNSEHYIIKTNNIVNTKIFELAEHKELLLNLLCACGIGEWTKHNWLPISKEKVDKMEKELRGFYKLSDEEWELKKNYITDDEKKEIMQFLGKMDK